MKRYPYIMATIAILTLLSTIFNTGYAAPNMLAAAKAFPGAMGYGTDTPGGRGGRVIYVTNMNDSGTGSLRTALTATGPRTVLFNVAGTITLASDIVVANPFLTIAGQTAPGEGIQIRGAQIKIATHDVIIRYLKMRSGDTKNSTSSNEDRDAITANNATSAYNIVVDHSTLIWGPDVGGITFLNGAHDSTVSHSIVGEGLYISNHSEATTDLKGHSMALNITQLATDAYPKRITIHHNLMTTSADRNPRVLGGENVDVVNNVIYNWFKAPAQGNPRSVNLIKNYFIKGPMTTRSESWMVWKPKTGEGVGNGTLRSKVVFEAGNITEGFAFRRGDPQTVYASTRFSPYSITTEDTPQDAYNKIINGAGANLQVAGSDGSLMVRRDSVDQRIINNLVGRRGTFVNGVNANGAAGYPAISWPTLANGTPATDNDKDGMPDAWEQAYFGTASRGSTTNSSGDFDNDGYTDLEEYLNRTNPKSQ